MTQSGGYVYLDTTANIKARIDSQAYTRRILNNVTIERQLTSLDFKVNILNKSNILTITYEAEKEDIDSGIVILGNLVDELRRDYDKDIQLKKDEFNRQIFMKNNQMAELNLQKKDLEKQIQAKEKSISDKYAQIEHHKASLKAYDYRIDNLLGELKSIKEKSQDILMDGGELSGGQQTQQKNGQSDILYPAAIQQGMSLFQELRNQINDLRIEKEFSRTSITALENDINDLTWDIERIKKEKTLAIQTDIDTLQTEIDKLKNRVNHIQGIKMISEPVSSVYPIKPKVRSMMILSLIAGIFFSVFAAFFIEYISNIRKRSEQE
ncbi:MAG TPA: hypothetical protein ENN05_10455 [Deltaproteobacteria bacterium]|nr:hypothetical protein [Deltaproteobacteria bacterium]